MTFSFRRSAVGTVISFAAGLGLWVPVGCTGASNESSSPGPSVSTDADTTDGPGQSEAESDADSHQGGAGGADAGSADTDGAGGTTVGGAGGGYIGDCYLYDSEGPDAGVELLACTAADGGGYSCHCGSEAHEGVAAGSCEAALLQACGVDLNAPHWCQGLNESCWPVSGAPDSWVCDCGDGVGLVEATAGTCHYAIQSACAHTCESALGSCTPGTELGWYECACYYYGSADRSVYESSCDQALNSGCQPFGNGGAFGCNTPSGYCDQHDARFDCVCIDGTLSTHYGGQCEETLAQACGAVEPPPDLSCDKQLGDTKGSCVASVGKPGWYSCGCSTSWDGGLGGWGNEVQAASCGDALDNVCFPP